MRNRLLLLLLVLPCLIAALAGLVALIFTAMFLPARARRIAVSFDQLANTVAGGDEDETISSRAAKAARRRAMWGCLLCALLNRFDPGHCESNIEFDEGRPAPPL